MWGRPIFILCMFYNIINLKQLAPVNNYQVNDESIDKMLIGS